MTQVLTKKDYEKILKEANIDLNNHLIGVQICKTVADMARVEIESLPIKVEKGEEVIV